MALKLLRGTEDPDEAFDYIPPPEVSENRQPAITAIEAIGDLPAINAPAQLRSGHLRRGARRFDKPVPWDRRRKVSAYARTMRTWPGFEAPDELRDHVIRYLPRDYELFALINPGDQYPQAWQHAYEMFEERLSALRNLGAQSIRVPIGIGDTGTKVEISDRPCTILTLMGRRPRIRWGLQRSDS